jgi:hypothetical protein
MFYTSLLAFGVENVYGTTVWETVLSSQDNISPRKKKR